MTSNVPIRIIGKNLNRGQFATEFSVNDYKYEFNAFNTATPLTPDIGGWEISFARMQGNDILSHKLSGDLDLKATLKVFSGVKKSIEAWVKWLKTESDFQDDDLHFYFTGKAEEASRVKIYNKFAKQIAKSLKLKVTKSMWFGEFKWEFK